MRRRKRRLGQPTWHTSVDNPEELLVAARITEERRVDGHRASRLAGAGTVQREMDVDVTVARVRHIALGGHQRVVAPVPRTVEHDQLIGRTDDLQYRIETDKLVETAVRRPRQRPHRLCIINLHTHYIFPIKHVFGLPYAQARNTNFPS